METVRQIIFKRCGPPTWQKSKLVDGNGNAFRYRAKVKDSDDAQLGRWAWDVFLTGRR